MAVKRGIAQHHHLPSIRTHEACGCQGREPDHGSSHGRWWRDKERGGPATAAAELTAWLMSHNNNSPNNGRSCRRQSIAGSSFASWSRPPKPAVRRRRKGARLRLGEATSQFGPPGMVSKDHISRAGRRASLALATSDDAGTSSLFHDIEAQKRQALEVARTAIISAEVARWAAVRLSRIRYAAALVVLELGVIASRYLSDNVSDWSPGLITAISSCEMALLLAMLIAAWLVSVASREAEHLPALASTAQNSLSLAPTAR